jgi:hypothetical protein
LMHAFWQKWKNSFALDDKVLTSNISYQRVW